MTIYVKMEFNENKTITLKVEASDTIKHIEGIIKNMENIPKVQQRLKQN